MTINFKRYWKMLKFKSVSDAVNLLFGEIAMGSNIHFETSYLETLLHSDTQLWKGNLQIKN